MAAIATGIKIGCRKLIIFAPTQSTGPAMTIKKTTKKTVSAAHIVFCCQGVGYSLMLCLEDRTSNIEWQASALVRYSLFDLGCSTSSKLLDRICIRRLAFAHPGFRTVDLFGEAFVLRIKRQGLLPGLHRLRDLIQLCISVAKVLENNRVVVLHFLSRANQIIQCGLNLSLTEFQPAERVEVGAVVWVELQSVFDQLLRFIEVQIVIGPHVSEVIGGIGGAGRIERD